MTIKITTQKELDQLTEVKAGDEVTIESTDSLKLNFNISVYGILKIFSKVEMSFSRKYVVAWGNSSVVAWENSSVEAWGNSSVVAWGNSSVVAWGNSSVVAWVNSSVEAWGNSSVVAWGNSSVVAWGNSSVKLALKYSIRVKVKLFGFSVCWKPADEKIAVEIKSKTALLQEYTIEPYLEREGIEVTEGKVILFKRVTHDFKTQENTKNETVWTLGTKLTHHAWDPTKQECGEGKFHACSRPYFCDEYRSVKGDIYIALEIEVANLYEWIGGSHPHKIAFREGTVLYVCNRFGKQITA